jgi:hypothetical protein
MKKFHAGTRRFASLAREFEGVGDSGVVFYIGFSYLAAPIIGNFSRHSNRRLISLHG